MSQDTQFGGVTDPDNPDNPDPTTITPQGDEYNTSGRTMVRAPWGQAFRSTDENLPVIDQQGTLMTKDQADAVVKEAADNGLTLTTNKDGE